MPLLTLIAVFISLCSGVSIGTNVPSDVIELNERFLKVKDDGYWFVEVCGVHGDCKTGA